MQLMLDVYFIILQFNIFYLCMPSDIFLFPAISLAAAAGGFLQYLDRGPKVKLVNYSTVLNQGIHIKSLLC